MVTDRVGPTITTLKAEVDYLDGEVKKLLNLLADARTESMKLRAALREIVRLEDEWVPQTQDDYSYGGYAVCSHIARAALEVK